MIQVNRFLTIIFLSSSIHAITDPLIDPKHELLTEIVGRYRLAARHFRESQTILPFEIQFPIHDIIKIDGSVNEFLIQATIELDYQFEFLHWDSNDTHNRYHDINEIVLPKTILQSLWLPDIHITDEDSISFNVEHESAKINRHGFIKWIRRGLFTINSPIDLRYYPFDRQYIRINMHNRQKTFKLQYQQNNNSKMNSYLSRSSSFLTTLFNQIDRNLNENNYSSNLSVIFQQNNQTIEPTISRGWFIRILGIEPNIEQGNLDNLNFYILLQRRRESHIYTTILPTLFFSVFVFIFYFSSIESYQRLIVGLLNILATLMFIIHLDKKISAEQLPYTPIIIRYLSIIFIIQILSLFFDHIIHSIYYGGLHFVSNWIRKNDKYDTQPARLSNVKLLVRGLHSPNVVHDGGTDLLMKQLIEREESLKVEDYQRYKWHKQARLSECLCCSFFLIIIIVVFIFIFFILPTFGFPKMTHSK